MLVIMETKYDPNKLKKNFNKLGFNGLLAINIIGYVGGIALTWKDDSMHITLIQKQFQFMHVKVQFHREEVWYFSPMSALVSNTKCNTFKERIDQYKLVFFLYEISSFLYFGLATRCWVNSMTKKIMVENFEVEISFF